MDGARVGVGCFTVKRTRESSIVRTAAVLAIAVASCVLPATAGAASSVSFDDPIGDMTYYAPDLGATTVTVGDDDTVALDTRIVPRPPAGWGGCAYTVGVFPYQTCVPADMNVTWYLDFLSGAGSVADDGADAKVVAIPSKGQTFWESSRWDTANGKFSAGAKPAATVESEAARWSLRLADLGIPRPATARVWVVSLYKSYNGLGVLLNYSDMAGPGTVAIAGPPAVPGAQGAPGAPAVAPSCRQATNTVNRLQRSIRSAKKRAAKGSRAARRSARRRLARLRSQRRRALTAMKRSCGSLVAGSPGSGTPVNAKPPTSAPAGCRLVTKTVLRQEGIGIYAKWVLKPEVVVECTK